MSQMDAVTVKFAADVYQGPANANVVVDGVPQPAVSVSAVYSAGATQTCVFSVPALPGGGAHSLGVEFSNDDWGGSSTTDRNLYVVGVEGAGPAYLIGKASTLAGGVVKLSDTGDAAAYAVAAAPEPPAYTPAYGYTFPAYDPTFLWTFDGQHGCEPPNAAAPMMPFYPDGWPAAKSTDTNPDVYSRYQPTLNQICCVEDTGIVFRDGGGLQLCATKQPGYHFPGQPWTTGGVTQNIGHALPFGGYFEADCIIPAEQGFMPSIWLQGATISGETVTFTGQNPAYEIDVLEWWNGNPAGTNGYHTAVFKDYSGQPEGIQQDFPTGIDMTKRHKFGVRMNPATLECDFYCDRVKVWSCIAPAFYTTPGVVLYWLANLGVGELSGTPTVSKAVMTIYSIAGWAEGSWGTDSLPPMIS